MNESFVTVIITSLLVARGCPDEHLDAAARVLASQPIPREPHEVIAQFDAAIQAVTS